VIPQSKRPAVQAVAPAVSCRLVLLTSLTVLLAACTGRAGPPGTPGAPPTTGGPPPTGGTSLPTREAAAAAPTVGDRMSLVFCADMPCPQTGSPDAPVTVVEISDYNCEYCREHIRDTQPLLMQEYVATGKVRWVSHVSAFLPPAQLLAAAALCAGEQGQYFAFQSMAFERQLVDAGASQQQGILDAGRDLGLDGDLFAACVNEGRYLGTVQASTTEAAEMGVGYTPAFIINGLMLEGAQDVDVFQTKIDQALARAGDS
jgi:protein-disulfide isomerase